VTRWRRGEDPASSVVSTERRKLIESYKPDLPGSKPPPEDDANTHDPAAEERRHYYTYEPQAKPAPVQEHRPRRPRGRPPGRKQRRQVHFHVDQDEDRLLLEAARHFGSQQKGLVAALHALHEVLELRQQVTRLQEAYDRQRVLLAEAEALFNNR
jgi:hypothetical protein